MLPTISPINILVSRATDPDHTPAEQAASLSAAKRLGATDLPDPPEGYRWCDGRAVPVEPSGIIPALRSDGGRWDERAWSRRLFGDDPEADNDNDEPATVPEPTPAPAIARRLSPMQTTILNLIAREGGADLQELMDATGASIASVRSTVSMLKQAGKAVVRDRGTRRYSVAA